MSALTLPKRVRALLRDAPDGLTAPEVGLVLEVSDSRTVAAALKAMPDTYVDRWVKSARGPYVRVWCACVPPQDCPRPPKQGRKR